MASAGLRLRSALPQGCYECSFADDTPSDSTCAISGIVVSTSAAFRRRNGIGFACQPPSVIHLHDDHIEY